MDIGGSLTKIAYYSTLPLKKIVYDSKDSDRDEEVVSVDYSPTSYAFAYSTLNFIGFIQAKTKTGL